MYMNCWGASCLLFSVLPLVVYFLALPSLLTKKLFLYLLCVGGGGGGGDLVRRMCYLTRGLPELATLPNYDS